MAIDWKAETRWLRRLGGHAKSASVRALLRMDRPPILIGGCGRSGTTLLLAILDAHPAIYGIPDETDVFIHRTFRARWLRALDARRRIATELVCRHIPGTPRRWCEKTPRNIHHFDAIRQELDRPRFINIVRDGRDVVTSVHPQTKAAGYHVDARRWVRDVKAGLRHRGDADVWTLRYEDLIDDPGATLRGLVAFLGEPFDERLLDFSSHTAIQSSRVWNDSAVRPLHAASIGRWRQPEHGEAVAAFYRTPDAVALLEQLGYAPG